MWKKNGRRHRPEAKVYSRAHPLGVRDERVIIKKPTPSLTPSCKYIGNDLMKKKTGSEKK